MGAILWSGIQILLYIRTEDSVQLFSQAELFPYNQTESCV